MKPETPPHSADRAYTIELMVDCWESIKTPEGYDTVWYAAQKAKKAKLPAPGEYVNEEQAEHAKLIWHLLCELPEESERVVFVTFRNMGKFLDLNKDRAQFVIHLLIKNGVISKARKGSQGISNRYRIFVYPDR